MLDKLIPMGIPYPIRGAIIRAIRTAIAILLGGISAAIADGSIVSQVHFIPIAYSPVITLALSTTFVAVDKYLRERGLVEDAKELAAGTPLTGTSVVDVPKPAVNVSNDVEEPPTTMEEQASVVDEATPDAPLTDDVNPTEFDDPVELDKL